MNRNGVMDLIKKAKIAKHHWMMYVKLTQEINDWLRKNLNIRLLYMYAGEDVEPLIDEVNGKKTVYCVLAEKEIKGRVRTGDVCILEDGSIVMVSMKVTRYSITREIIKLV